MLQENENVGSGSIVLREGNATGNAARIAKAAQIAKGNAAQINAGSAACCTNC